MVWYADEGTGLPTSVWLVLEYLEGPSGVFTPWIEMLVARVNYRDGT